MKNLYSETQVVGLLQGIKTKIQKHRNKITIPLKEESKWPEKIVETNYTYSVGLDNAERFVDEALEEFKKIQEEESTY